MDPLAIITSSRKKPGEEPTPDYILRISADSFEAFGRPTSLMANQASVANDRYKQMSTKDWRTEFEQMTLDYKDVASNTGYGANVRVVVDKGAEKRRVDGLVKQMLADMPKPERKPPARRRRAGANGDD